jgi:preprotein translocase subunit YajC
MGILLTTAQDAASAGGGAGSIIVILGYALVIGGLWFFMMRPQRKEQKRTAAMLRALETGDYVLTTAGFYGVVIDITDDTVIVEFGNNKNCRIPMQKAAISRVEKSGEA